MGFVHLVVRPSLLPQLSIDFMNQHPSLQPKNADQSQQRLAFSLNGNSAIDPLLALPRQF
jgi:hypothetical protein